MKKPFILKSINWIITIIKKCLIKIIEYTSTFYLLKNLNSFDGINGYHFFKRIEGTIDIWSGYLYHRNGKMQLQHLYCNQVHLKESVPVNIRTEPSFTLQHKSGRYYSHSHRGTHL